MIVVEDLFYFVGNGNFNLLGMILVHDHFIC